MLLKEILFIFPSYRCSNRCACWVPFFAVSGGVHWEWERKFLELLFSVAKVLGSWNFRSLERMFQGAKVPGNKCSWNFRSRERKFHTMELSLPGAKVLRSESSCYLLTLPRTLTLALSLTDANLQLPIQTLLPSSLFHTSMLQELCMRSLTTFSAYTYWRILMFNWLNGHEPQWPHYLSNHIGVKLSLMILLLLGVNVATAK